MDPAPHHDALDTKQLRALSHAVAIVQAGGVASRAARAARPHLTPGSARVTGKRWLAQVREASQDEDFRHLLMEILPDRFAYRRLGELLAQDQNKSVSLGAIKLREQLLGRLGAGQVKKSERTTVRVRLGLFGPGGRKI